jgi:histidyl-tRNA synthetase
MFEDVELFTRTSGETSDVVSKEMYVFKDRGDRDLALKPEGTAPAMRSVIENSLCPPGTTLRLCYITPCFRYGRPGKGRYRQLHQVGLELIGSQSILADSEVIEATYQFFVKMGVSDARVSINSLGREECRTRYRQVVLDHAESWLKDQSLEEQEKARKNPLRLLDTKDPAAKAALAAVPPVLDYLEDDCRERFEQLQASLSEAKVSYRVDPGIVRGLDYYTETVFEVESANYGSLCGGGRYDGLIKEIGGSPTPSVGVGIGVERLLLVLEDLGKSGELPRIHVYVAGESAAVTEIARGLRTSGLATQTDLERRKLGNQMKQAAKSGARFAVIVGHEDSEAGQVIVRDLATGDQRQVAISELTSVLL